MNARVFLIVAPCVLAACEQKKSPEVAPAPTPGKPMTAGGSAATPVAPAPPPPATALPGLAKDPGGSTGKPLWGTSFGGEALDAARDVVVDAAGNAYVAGYFEGEATFGALGTRAPRGKSDAFVVRLGPTGELAWAQSFGAEREDVANGIAIDGKGNVVVAGNFLDALSIGADAKPLTAKSVGSDDLFVAGFTADGAPTWLWTAGGIYSDGANAVAAHPDGGWVVGGSFIEYAELGANKLTSQGGPDGFVVKLAPTGEVVWALQVGGSQRDAVLRVATDPAGAVYVLAQFSRTAYFGGEPLVAAGNAYADLAVAKYDASGKHLWSMRIGNEFEDVARGFAVDPAGNVTIAGSYDYSLQVGDNKFTSAGNGDIFVAHLGSDGKIAWARSWGGNRDDVAQAAAADAAGNVIIGGWIQGKVDFGGGPLASKGNQDAFVAKLDPSGALVWAQSFGDRDHDQTRAVAVDAQGNATAAGLFRYTLDVVKPPLVAVRPEGKQAPPADVFVLRLAR